MDFHELMARNLAAALLSVEWRESALEAAMRACLGGKRQKGQRKLLSKLLATFAGPVPPAPAHLSAFLERSAFFRQLDAEPPKLKMALAPPVFAPAARFAALDIPKLTTIADLAAWLQLSPGELDWFADARRTQAKTPLPTLRHYDYRFVARSNGPPRLLEAPKSRLKALQRAILRDILDEVPVHESAYGFVAGRSCVGAANRHAGETVVVTLDLKDFFLTVPMGRVHALYRCLGYPHAVADYLTRLSGAATPRAILEQLAPAQRFDVETAKRLMQLHLPQGAPTSPALANLVAFRLDTRLAGLARRYSVAYSRYADDLAFSGDEIFARRTHGFIAAISAIVADEGFTMNARKTRVMRRSARQRVTGIVVNDHLNAPRDSFDLLKAVLHNCAKNGPNAENREGLHDFRAYLDGRVLWFQQLNPARGAKLRETFERIDWRA